MSETTRRRPPDERVTRRPVTNQTRHNIAHPAPTVGDRHAPSTTPYIIEAKFDLPPFYPNLDTPTQQTIPHPDTLGLTGLLEAFEEGDNTIVALVGALPDTWRVVNYKVTTVTKRALEQSIWGTHTESNSL